MSRTRQPAENAAAQYLATGLATLSNRSAMACVALVENDGVRIRRQTLTSVVARCVWIMANLHCGTPPTIYLALPLPVSTYVPNSFALTLGRIRSPRVPPDDFPAPSFMASYTA